MNSLPFKQHYHRGVISEHTKAFPLPAALHKHIIEPFNYLPPDKPPQWDSPVSIMLIKEIQNVFVTHIRLDKERKHLCKNAAETYLNRAARKSSLLFWNPLRSGGNLYSLFPLNLKKLEKAQFGLREKLPCFMCKTVSLSHYPR